VPTGIERSLAGSRLAVAATAHRAGGEHIEHHARRSGAARTSITKKGRSK
jgi:hypothetical protein